VPRYSHVLFDFDLTLFDTRTSIDSAIRTTLVAAGHADDDETVAQFNRINQDLWGAVEGGKLLPDALHPERFRKLVAELDSDADPEAMADDFAAGLVRHGDLYRGVRRCLHVLAASVPVALVTNGLASIQRGRLDRLGIAAVFAAVAISDELGVAKPDPEIFDTVLGQLGDPDRSRVLMVGDSLPSDIAGGREAGLATCWLAASDAADPAPAPTHRIADLTEVVGIVEP